MSDQPPKPKRKYTMSQAALEARRANAQNSTGPKTDEGKAASSRNAWIHGLYSGAANLTAQQWGSLGMLGKPCRKTCPHHPESTGPGGCTLVIEGQTKAGQSCLDKTVYMAAFNGLMSAMQDGKSDSMHSALAAEAAGAMELLVGLRQSIAEDGLTISIPAISKDGEVVLHPKTGEPLPSKILANPSIAHYANLLDKLGINLSNLLATPRAVSGLQQAEDGAGALAELLGGAFSRVNAGASPRVIEHHGDDQ
jgi:hypothetical protein